MQKSTSFILPLFNISYNNSIIKTYLSCPFFQGNDKLNEFFYIETIDINLLRMLKSHPRYYRIILTPKNTYLVVFNYTTEEKLNIVRPFINGKYSEIDRDYVSQSFPVYTSTGVLSGNYAILTKSPTLKKYWEDRIGVTLDDDAEVWSKIKEQEETYYYE